MKAFHFLIALTVLTALLSVSPAFGSNWVEYGTDYLGNVHSYDANPKKIVRVSERTVFADRGRETYIQTMKNRGGSTEGYGRISSSVSLIEIDCTDRMIRTLSVIVYDKNGTILFDIGKEKPEWNEILPGSLEESLQEKVCK